MVVSTHINDKGVVLSVMEIKQPHQPDDHQFDYTLLLNYFRREIQDYYYVLNMEEK